MKQKFANALSLALIVAMLFTSVALASDVDVAVVDVSIPFNGVTLAPGASGNITITMTVTGNQAGTATFEVYRNWTLSGGLFTGSNPQEFTVGPRAGGDPANVFSTSGTVTVAAGQAAGGPFTLTVSTFDITNSNSSGGKLVDRADGIYFVTVSAPANTAPTLSLPGNLTVEATSAAGAVVNYTATATDTEDNPDPTPSCSPTSGSTFPLGTTTVNCSVADSGGLSASGSFTITVQDTAAPTLTLPGDLTLEATSSAGATVTFTATANDAVSGSVPVTCVPASGSTFGFGSTSVSCSATDGAGNTATDGFSILVQDTTAPVLTLPDDITEEAAGPTGTAVTYTATASDAVDGSVTPTCTPPSGSTFPLGPTTVNCSASDSRDNTTNGSFSITVVDTTPPVITVPADITVEATGPSGAAVSFVASASDIVDGALTASCSPASGATFPLGTTTVTCSATDAAGNPGSNSFTVKVQDTTAPTLTLPSNMTISATSATGAVVTYTASASDIVDGSVAVSCSPASGSTFAPGTTTVTCSATDAAGNPASGSFTVAVKFQLRGFYQPVDMTPAGSPTVWNTVKNGSTVPLKFEVFAGSTELTDTSLINQPLKATQQSCTGGTTDDIELVATGSTSLRYDTTAGQFIYNWQTPKKAGFCYVVTVTTADGSSLTAYFRLK